MSDNQSPWQSFGLFLIRLLSHEALIDDPQTSLRTREHRSAERMCQRISGLNTTTSGRRERVWGGGGLCQAPEKQIISQQVKLGKNPTAEHTYGAFFPLFFMVHQKRKKRINPLLLLLLLLSRADQALLQRLPSTMRPTDKLSAGSSSPSE